MSSRTGLGPSISEKERARRHANAHAKSNADSKTRTLPASSPVARPASKASPRRATGTSSATPTWTIPEWGDSMEAFTKGELSRAFALGNITRKEWKNHGAAGRKRVLAN